MALADDNGTSADTNGPAGEPDRDLETEREADGPSESGGMADWTKALREVAPYLDLGWRLAGATAGPPLIGYFLIDAWFGTTPWALLVGCAVGLAAAGLQLKRLQEDFDR